MGSGSEDWLDKLLGEACAKGGYCQAQFKSEELRAQTFASVEELADAIVRAEGLDPETMRRPARRAMQELVRRHFSEAQRPPIAEIPSSLDRYRGCLLGLACGDAVGTTRPAMAR